MLVLIELLLILLRDLKDSIRSIFDIFVDFVQENLILIAVASWILGPTFLMWIFHEQLRAFVSSNITSSEPEKDMITFASPFVAMMIQVLLATFVAEYGNKTVRYIRESIEEAKDRVDIRYAMKAQSGDLSQADTSTQAGGITITEDKIS